MNRQMKRLQRDLHTQRTAYKTGALGDKAVARLVGDQQAANNLVDRLAGKVTGVLDQFGYSSGPTGRALNLWKDIIAEKRLPKDFLKRALDVTFGSVREVAMPLIGDLTKSATQAVIQTAIPAAAGIDERFARDMVLNSFDMYFYPHTRPLRIGAGAEMDALRRALAARRVVIEADEEPASDWDDAPRDVDALVSRAVEEAAVSTSLMEMASTGAVPDAPALPSNLVWKKVDEQIEQAKIKKNAAVAPDDWAASIAPTFDVPKPRADGTVKTGKSVLVDFALNLVSNGLREKMSNLSEAEIASLVDEVRPYAASLANKLRNEVLATPPPKAEPASGKGTLAGITKVIGGVASNEKTVSDAVNIVNTGVGLFSNFMKAFSSRADISTAFLTMAAASYQRRPSTASGIPLPRRRIAAECSASPQAIPRPRRSMGTSASIMHAPTSRYMTKADVNELQVADKIVLFLQRGSRVTRYENDPAASTTWGYEMINQSGDTSPKRLTYHSLIPKIVVDGKVSYLNQNITIAGNEIQITATAVN